MPPSPAAQPPPPSRATAPTTRPWWLAGVAVRVAIGLAALPLTPLLFREQLLTLVAMRPTREFLLLGGFQVRAGDIELPLLILASLPMFLLGNWIFFGLGRAFRDELSSGAELPSWLAQFADPEQVARLQRVLAKRGTLLVVLARLAIFPATLLAAAAGASPMSTRRFLLADSTSAALAYAQYVGAGYVLGRAYDTAGPWITVTGVALLAAILWIFGRALRDEDAAGGPSEPGNDLVWPRDPEPDTPSA